MSKMQEEITIFNEMVKIPLKSSIRTICFNMKNSDYLEYFSNNSVLSVHNSFDKST